MPVASKPITGELFMNVPAGRGHGTNDKEFTMTRRSIIGFFCLMLAFSISSLSAGTTPAMAGEKAFFVDILYLQKGKTVADAQAYFDIVIPVIAGHGLERITPAFEITKKMSGKISPDLVNVWSVSDAESTFPAIFSDPAYTDHIEMRDSTFDMKRSHMFMLNALQ